MEATRTALLIDRNRLFREGLKQLLHDARVTVAGDGPSFEEALCAVAADTPLDLAICNQALIEDQPDGMQAVRLSKRRFPHAKLMILTDAFSLSGALAAAQAGADAYLPTDMQKRRWNTAWISVLLGQQLFPASFALRQAPEAAEAGCRGTARVTLPGVPEGIELPVQLSVRERQILRYLVIGWSNKLIARELDIAEATVKVHVKGLLRKARAANRTQITIWAIGHGISAKHAMT